MRVADISMVTHDPYRADLQYLLLRDYEGDLGVRSSFGAMVSVLESGGHSGRDLTYDLTDDILDAAARLRRLSRRWAALPEAHQRTLRTHYGATRRVLPEWGDLGWLVLSRPLCHAEHADSKTDKHIVAWLSRLPVRPAMRPVYQRIRTDAMTALDSARAAWAATRHVGGKR